MAADAFHRKNAVAVAERIGRHGLPMRLLTYAMASMGVLHSLEWFFIYGTF